MQSATDESRPDEADQLDDFDEPEREEPEQLDEGESQGEPDSGEADETEDTGDGESAAPVRTERRPGRRERQQAEVRELRERSDRLERELASIRSQSQRPPQVDPAELARREQVEREQVAVLPFDQQVDYWRRKDRAEVQSALANLQVQHADSSDRMSWDAKAASDPVKARFSREVEQLLQQERAAGRNYPREVLYYALLGRETDQQRGKQTNKQRQEAQKRVRAQTTQPGGGRSDVQRQRAPAGDSYEAALQRISGRPLW